MMTNKCIIQLENFERDFQHAKVLFHHNVNITSHFAAPRRSENYTNNQNYMKNIPYFLRICLLRFKPASYNVRDQFFNHYQYDDKYTTRLYLYNYFIIIIII
jgi:hypothetical protein